MFKKNAVSGQNEYNFLKTTKHEMGCCDGDAVDCQYSGSYTQANTVSELTISENGADVVLPLVLSGGATAAEVKAAIIAALAAADYYDDDNPDWPGVTVVDAGTTLDIVITGDIVVVSLTASGGTSDFTAACNPMNLCTFAADAFTAGAGSKLHINGNIESIGDITAGTTSAATVKSSIESALSNQGITATATVTTTGSGTSQVYNVSIAAVASNNTLYLVGADGVSLYLSALNCAQSYVA